MKKLLLVGLGLTLALPNATVFGSNCFDDVNSEEAAVQLKTEPVLKTDYSSFCDVVNAFKVAKDNSEANKQLGAMESILDAGKYKNVAYVLFALNSGFDIEMTVVNSMNLNTKELLLKNYIKKAKKDASTVDNFVADDSVEVSSSKVKTVAASLTLGSVIAFAALWVRAGLERR